MHEFSFVQGTSGFERLMDRLMELSEYMVRRIKEQPDRFRLVMQPELVNVCFWYLPRQLRERAHDAQKEVLLGKVRLPGVRLVGLHGGVIGVSARLVRARLGYWDIGQRVLLVPAMPAQGRAHDTEKEKEKEATWEGERFVRHVSLCLSEARVRLVGARCRYWVTGQRILLVPAVSVEGARA